MWISSKITMLDNYQRKIKGTVVPFIILL